MVINEQIAGEYSFLIEKCGIRELIKKVCTDGWSETWPEVKTLYYNESLFQNTQERNISIDLFFGFCLKRLVITGDNLLLIWEMAWCWFQYRRLPVLCGGLPPKEILPLVNVCLVLRQKICDYLQETKSVTLFKVSDEQYWNILTLWRNIFLNPFSPLNLYAQKVSTVNKNKLLQENNYALLLRESALHPFSSDGYSLDIEKIMTDQKLPLSCKAMICFWIINLPQSSLEAGQREKMLRDVPVLLPIISNCENIMSPYFFKTFTEDLKVAFWRLSYIDGNNIKPLSMFGDFIVKNMAKFYPQILQFSQRDIGSLLRPGKIRVGYISSYFGEHAVSHYMLNRILCYNREKFSVYIFALGERNDQITAKIKESCDHFYSFLDASDIGAIAGTILDAHLDVLIYPDIGLDTFTYFLAGLQLAPVQCALAGHGTTTGLSTIQYYISGDFETEEAQLHYRENLVRLPSLGAVQFPPRIFQKHPQRQDFHIPEQAIVFISCANSIKHHPARDKLLITILRRVPEAYLILKPFPSTTLIEPAFMQRISAVAQKAKVQDRLLVLPPMKHNENVLGLLTLADLQLDTYPYGGWTTNLEALYMGLPIITQQGSLARSRWGAGMLKALGINQGIADTENEFVEWAVKLAKDDVLRTHIKNKIKQTVKQILFNGPAHQPEYEKLLETICQS